MRRLRQITIPNSLTAEGHVRSPLSYQARCKLVERLAPQYHEAPRAQKIGILDSFVAVTSYTRKYAIHLLNHAAEMKQTLHRPRPPHYGAEVQRALHLAWAAANHICAKRLIPFLPTLVEVLERHGHLHLSEESRSHLLSMSAATADRLLHSHRKAGPRGLSTTRAGTLLKNQIPIRSFRDWNETQPGLTSSRSGGPWWHPSRGRLLVYPDPH